MIECKAKNKKTYYHPNNGWTMLGRNQFPSPADFTRLVFKINGKIYTEWNDEVEAVVAWEKLKQ